MSDALPVGPVAMGDLVESLNDKQRTAFESLRCGSSFAVAAEQAGVGRVTVYRWVKSDPHFRAVYNAWRQQQAESAQARLLRLADKAVDCVETALASNDYGTAVAVLSKMGIMRQVARGSIDPEVVRMQQELEQKREEYKAAINLLRHLLEKAGLTPEEQTQYIRQHGVNAAQVTEQRPASPPEPRATDEQSTAEAPQERSEEIPPDSESFPIDAMAAALAERVMQDPDGLDGGTHALFGQAG